MGALRAPGLCRALRRLGALASLLPLALAQDQIGPLVDFSKEFPERLNEELVMNVIAGDFVLEAELGLETNFEDIDRVLRGTLGQICQHSQFFNAPVTVERFLDMESLVLRRKAFRYKWWLLPLQSHPLPGDCMSNLAQVSYGPTQPPYEEIGKKVPPIRNLFAIELLRYTATSSMDSSYWGLTLRNVSCIPHRVKRAIIDGEASSTTPIPTHVCDGRLYATGGEQDEGFDPNQVSDCGMAKEDPCLCLTLTDCEWQPGTDTLPGGCAATANPGVTCQACPFQPKCREPEQSELCRVASSGCDCAFTKATSNGNGCVFMGGGCVPRPTPDSAVTSCDACPTQVRCGTPVVQEISPEVGTTIGEMGIWAVQVVFDRPIYAHFKADDTGVAIRCNIWEPMGGTTYRISPSKLSIVENVLEIDLHNVVSDKRKTCVLSVSTNVIKSVRSDLPYPGINDGSYFLFLPDTERPTVSTYQPPNSARGLGLEFEVHLTFTEPIFPGKVSSARHIELYQTGDAANAGQLLEIIDFSDQRVALQTDVFKVQLDGLEPNKFYCLVLPPLSLSDREGNNFTGIPRNHYIFGTSSDTTVEEIAWTESLFIIIGIVLVAVFVAVGGVVGYFVMTSGRQNAKVFAKQVRTKSKVSQVHPDETHVEDLDDGFFTQKQLESSEGAKSAELLRQHSNVAVAWDGPRPATGGDFSPPLMHQSSSLSPGLVHQSSNLQVQSVSPRELPREPHLPPRGTPRPVSSPRPEMLRDEEGFGSRSGSQVATLIQAQRTGSLGQSLVPPSKPEGSSSRESSKARSSKEGPPRRSLSHSQSISPSPSPGSVTRESVRTTVSLPRAPGRGGSKQGPQMPSEPSPELSGYSSLENSKMNLSGSFKGALFNAAPNTLAESAAVSRSMSKALRSTARPVSRGQQTPVRPSHA